MPLLVVFGDFENTAVASTAYAAEHNIQQILATAFQTRLVQPVTLTKVVAAIFSLTKSCIYN